MKAREREERSGEARYTQSEIVWALEELSEVDRGRLIMAANHYAARLGIFSAQDITQAAYLRLLEHPPLKQFSIMQILFGAIKSIAYHESKRQSRFNLSADMESEDGAQPLWTESAPSPEQQILARTELKYIFRVLDKDVKRGPIWREMIKAKMKGLSAKQTERALGLSFLEAEALRKSLDRHLRNIRAQIA